MAATVTGTTINVDVEAASVSGSVMTIDVDSATFANMVATIRGEAPASPPTSAPGRVLASALSNQRLRITWNVVTATPPVLSYQVGLRVGFLGTESFVGAVGTSLTTQSLQARTTYFYRVRAVNAGGNGPWSGLQSIRTGF